MRSGLEIGQVSEFSIEVTPAMQPQFGDTIIHPLYSTAAMINHMEWAARQHILPYLEPGEEGAGYHIDVKHLVATPLGATVNIRSTVKKVTPKRVISQVEAWHGPQKIGEGTLTQAIVPLKKLYTTCTGPDDASDDILNPPPAVLQSIDGQQAMSFEVLRWETGSLPCTRYDEWLICRTSANEQAAHTGPFLLRYEIEEWFTALEGIAEGKVASYQSDFLEPVLKVTVSAAEPGEWQWACRFSAPADRQTESVLLKMDVTTTALKQFAEQLQSQLKGFPSLL